MNSQTIQDSVNKYRYGVKIGNYNEETFGRDLVEKDLNWKTVNSTMKDSFRMQNTIHNIPMDQMTPEEKEFHDRVQKDTTVLDPHVLFGHGVRQEDFEKRQLTSTYDLSFNRKVLPQQQIHSKYEPTMTTNTLQQKKLNVTDKVTNVNDIKKDDLNHPKRYIHYDEFTKHFDSNHIKIPLRK